MVMEMEEYFENLFQMEADEKREEEKEEEREKDKRKDACEIRHLVLSGGSVWGLKTYGALRYCFLSGFLQMDKIESIYATSVGSMIGAIIAMKLEFDVVDNYIIKRPWHQVWTVLPENLLTIADTWGIFTRTFMDDFFKPLLQSIGFDLDLTLAEFYAYSNIDLHIFATEINTFQWRDISHKTHPTWKLVDAVYASCCVPLFFAPLKTSIVVEDEEKDEDKDYDKDKNKEKKILEECYIDGGIHMNYPLSPCVESVGKENIHRIFGILLPPICYSDEMCKINGQSTFFDYMGRLLNKLMESRLFINDLSYRIPYQLNLESQSFSIEYLFYLISKSEERKTLIEKGSTQMQIWVDSLNR